ncbi:GNAT family N-acetyltransferase [Paenibacillus sp. LHD-117]|uniref:GNAT family N-acetyltransferase n=1 Tax=Paenibacillus sp. LHD-117 TaxID=3071412 RepID=UPI0027E01919|nr:GNAT family N-acetyltransferase [Paenibacillus sp. LHD-117]MDQ6420593.1 GNAT family N-acetyltransferase [Paenibacillus sp. LHD-117]
MNSPTILSSTNDESNDVRKKLIAFNSRHVPNGIYEEVNLCIKNDKEEIIAGLNSAICWNWMEIDILWVSDDHRGQGYGKRLLEKAEQVAIQNNCDFIKLNTFSFQAPEFYKKYGYKVIAIIEDAPTGYKHYYFKKDLNRQ